MSEAGCARSPLGGPTLTAAGALDVDCVWAPAPAAGSTAWGWACRVGATVAAAGATVCVVCDPHPAQITAARTASAEPTRRIIEYVGRSAPARYVRRRFSSEANQLSKSPANRANTAPWGSWRMPILPIPMSIGPISLVAPSSVAFASDASMSSVPKYTSQ